MRHPVLGWLALGCCFLCAGPRAWAEEASAPDSTVTDSLEARIDALESELASLRDALAALRDSAAESGAEDRAPLAPAAAPGANVFNPDIGLNTLMSINFDTGRLSDAAIDFEETELSLAGVVDPYASYFGTLVFTGEEVEVEEAFATLTNFPADLTTTLGRRLVPIGLWNPTHKHAWPLNNPPLVIEHFFGSPHLIGTGLNTEYTWGGDQSWTASAGIYTEVESTQFTQEGLEHPLLAGRFSTFIDQPGGGLQFGLNAVHGPTNEAGSTGATALGLDAKWRTGSMGNTDRTLVQGEAWWNRHDGLLRDFDALGAYLLAERQVARDWTLGGRIEFAEDTFGDETTDRWSVYANWARTEFYRWRLQFDQTDGADEAISLQALFTLGPHPAHPF